MTPQVSGWIWSKLTEFWVLETLCEVFDELGTNRALCYLSRMRPVEAQSEQGTLKLAQPLPLRPGERVRVIVVRKPDPKRWDMSRLRAAGTSEEDALSEAGLADWGRTLDGEGSD